MNRIRTHVMTFVVNGDQIANFIFAALRPQLPMVQNEFARKTTDFAVALGSFQYLFGDLFIHGIAPGE